MHTNDPIKHSPQGERTTPSFPDKFSTPVFDRVINIGDLQLEHGHHLRQAKLSICCYGDIHSHAKRPTYIVLGGISANRFIADTHNIESQTGWWTKLAGPGKALDTQKTNLIGIDFLGSGQSSAPQYNDEFIISPNDQAHALNELLNKLGIDRVDGMIGSSYGGSVALCFARLFPNRMHKALILCAAHKADVLTSGYRSIQRSIVRQACRQQRPTEGLALARQLAMLGFRTAEELSTRFCDPVECNNQRVSLPVESYLQARAADWAQHTQPAEFICLSQSCDLIHVDPKKIELPVWVAAAANDAIIPFSDVQTLAQQLPQLQCLTELKSPTGHDAFLTETEQLQDLLTQFLNTSSNITTGAAA